MEERLLGEARRGKDAFLAKTYTNGRRGGGGDPVSFLAHAIRCSMNRLSEYLLHQRRHDYDLNETFDTGDTAIQFPLIHHAIKRHMGRTVELLVERGADLTKENGQGQTPLAYARSCLGPLEPGTHRTTLEGIVELLENNTPKPYKRQKREDQSDQTTSASDWTNMLSLDGPFPPNFTVEVSDGKEVKAHKEVLAKRSAYFERLLGGNWRESAMDRVKVDDVSYEEMDWVIRSLYKYQALPLPSLAADVVDLTGEEAGSAGGGDGGSSGSSSSSSAAGAAAAAPPPPPTGEGSSDEPLPIRLLKLTDRFDLGFLKDGLEEVISEHLDAGNVLGILMSAHKSGARNLEKCCANFLLLDTNLYGALEGMNRAGGGGGGGGPGVQTPTDPAEAVALVDALRRGGRFRCVKLTDTPAAGRAAAPRGGGGRARAVGPIG